MTKYRNNVAGFIVNNKNQVLIVRRARSKGDNWQIPQGGVEENETEDKAILREMKEELGADNFDIMGTHPKQHVYDWPPHIRQFQDYKKQGYIGQSQTIYYLKYSGGGADIKVDGREHDKFKWVKLDKVVELVQPVRRKMTQMALDGYRKLSKKT